MYLNIVGGQLGIYPEELIESFTDTLKERKLLKFPIRWMNARERWKHLVPTYFYGQPVYSQKTSKAYISLIDGNVEDPDEEESITKNAWKEIVYTKPGSTTLVPGGVPNPLEELLTLFKGSFSIATLFP
jgi:hypothetical protein